jgi:HKD family nuclease
MRFIVGAIPCNRPLLSRRKHGFAPTIIAFFIAALSFTAMADAITVDVVDISNRAYFPALITELNNAKENITVAMYAFFLPQGEEGGSAYKLFNALLDAHARGVEVTVYLNHDNQNAYNLLKEAGINTFLLNSKTKLHAKLIIIDNATVIEGSANWTDNAINDNAESNSIFRSTEFAKTKAAFFETLKTQIAPEPKTKVVPSVDIPVDFLLKPQFAPRMVADSDVRPFQLYLLLLKSQNNQPITLDYLKTGQALGIPIDSHSSYRQQIRLFAEKLKTKYDLIDYTFDKKNQLIVAIKPCSSTARFSVPVTFWDYGYAKTLRLREQFSYLASVNEQATTTKAYWSKGQEELAKKYSIDNVLFCYSFRVLKQLDIIEIIPGRAIGDDYLNRGTNLYRVKTLISEQDKAKIWKKLEKQYTPDAVKIARNFAATFDEANNISTVKAMIKLMLHYPTSAIEEAIKRISNYGDENPLKNVRYLEGIIKNVVAETQA